MENKPEQSKAAIASFVLGILSLIFSVFTAIPALVFGIIALVIIGKSRGLLKGKGFAIAGIILSVVSMLLLLIIMIGLLVPALCQVKEYSREIQQKSQFHSIDVAIETFKSDFGAYPDSFDNLAVGTESSVSSQVPDSKNYGGAQKLAEALVGRDLLGFHPDSKFRSNGMDDSGKSLYLPETVKVRKGPYLNLENINVCQLNDVFKDVGALDGNTFVICDVYEKERSSGKKTGMPVLYFKANTSSETMEAGVPVDQRIYNIQDNLSLIRIAGVNGAPHPLAEDNGKLFYESDYKIIQPKITNQVWPHKPNSYILISAGPDGFYGTSDDIVNFDENQDER